jgi:hypothetical protein
MKPRSDSILFKLNNNQQAQLYDWILTLGYQKAKDEAAKPPPDGFAVKTHLNSLSRFARRYAEIQKEKEFFDILHGVSDEPDPRVMHATENFVHHIAFDLATSPGQTLDTFRQVTRWLGKLQDEKHRAASLKLATARLAFDRERQAVGSPRPSTGEAS